MAQQRCKSLQNALSALLSEPAPNDSLTRGLTQKYEAVESALNSCCNPPWSLQVAKRLVQDKVPLKVWKLCSQLAATCHSLKGACSANAAYKVLQCMHTAGTVHLDANPAADQTSATTGRRAAALAQQLQQSGLMEHLPMLLTDAAHQLQAVSGVWPVCTPDSDKARFESVLASWPHPGVFAEWRATNTQQLLVQASRLLPACGIQDMRCLLAAEHCVLASWQYLSTVLQDGAMDNSSGDFLQPTAAQQQLTSSATGLAITCTLVGSKALDEASANSSSADMAPADTQRTPAHPALFSRQHVECMTLTMALLQLELKMRSKQQQQASTVPAPLHKALQKLGVSSSTVLWALKQSAADYPLRLSTAQIPAQLGEIARSLMCMCHDHDRQQGTSNRTSETLPELHELQQQLQLLMLLPSVLLQWVVDMPSSHGNHSYHCVQVFWAICSLIDTYNEVLLETPASLYQHMTGHPRPPEASSGGYLGRSLLAGAPGAHNNVRVPLPADAYAMQLQLLGQLVPFLLQLWCEEVGVLETARKGTPGPGQDTARSTGSTGDRGKHPGSRRSPGSSVSGNEWSGRVGLERAVMAAGDLVLKMADAFPVGLIGASKSAAGGASAGATGAAAAGQLCALLEHMCRAELAVTQHNIATAPTAASCSSSNSSQTIADADRRYNISNNITWSLVSVYDDGPNFNIGPLVDPIIAHSSPGSKPCQQLCGLMTTMLKIAQHVSRRTPTQTLQLREWGGILCPWSEDFSKTHEVLLRELARVIKITCAVVDASMARQAAPEADSNNSAGAGDSSSSGAGVSSSNDAGVSSSSSGVNDSSSTAANLADVSSMLPLLVLLGRCCLQLGALPASLSPKRCLVGAALQFYLDSAVHASTGWLSACSHAAQLQALGYDAEGILECLQHAAAVSNRVNSTLHASNALVGRQAAVSQLQEQLRAVGGVLTNFALPNACNNPACMSFSGPSEASLVQGNNSRCGSCRAARYCSKGCQRAAWKQHKPVRKALTAAAAAAVGADKPDAVA